MRKILNPVLLLSLAGAFLFSSVICCCVGHAFKQHAVKSCCDKSQKSKSSKDDCGGCSSMVKSAENAKAFHLGTPVDGHIVPVTISAISFKPVHVIKSVFANGPPGLVVVVPLYTQFHSLRI